MAVTGTLGCRRAETKSATSNAPTKSVVANRAEPWLVDETPTSGIHFRHESGHESLPLFPEIMGGGAALFDMDNDGDLDLYCVQSGALQEDAPGISGNALYANDGSGKFTRVQDPGAEDTGYGMGVAAADYDNDGDVDLYVTNVGPNVLLQNDGAGKFRDVTAEAGVGNDRWGTSSAFLDYDRDGDLDLYVCNYIHWSMAEDLRCTNGAGTPDYCNPTSYSAPEPDVLFKNLGDGTFADVSVEAGLRSSFGNGLGVVCGDFNGDGHADIFVANDGTNNQFWLNQGDGTFLDRAMVTGCAVDKNGKAKAGMGTCAADIDDDGDLDLLVVNLQAQSDSFFRNEGAFFVDDTPSVGLGSATRPYTRFGVGWADFDHDGDLDLFQVNGRVTLPDQENELSDDPFAERNLFLIRDESRYQVADASQFPQTMGTSRAAAFGDLDNDGAVDIVVVNRDGPPEVIMNRKADLQNWLLVRAVNRWQRDDTGATIRFTFGDHTLRREVNPHYSYLASNDPRVHVGCGSSDTVNSITVEWMDGTTQDLKDISCNQILEIRQVEEP